MPYLAMNLMRFKLVGNQDKGVRGSVAVVVEGGGGGSSSSSSSSSSVSVLECSRILDLTALSVLCSSFASNYKSHLQENTILHVHYCIHLRYTPYHGTTTQQCGITAHCHIILGHKGFFSSSNHGPQEGILAKRQCRLSLRRASCIDVAVTGARPQGSYSKLAG